MYWVGRWRQRGHELGTSMARLGQGTLKSASSFVASSSSIFTRIHEAYSSHDLSSFAPTATP